MGLNKLKRENLIEQVKQQYSEMASEENHQHITQSTENATPEAYYEKILALVIEEISAGTFDNFNSGQQIIEQVSKDKSKWLSSWDQEEIV